MKRMKTYGIIALVIVFLVVVIQNVEAVPIQFLGWRTEVSRALLFPIILLIGFCIGYVTAKWPRKKT